MPEPQAMAAAPVYQAPEPVYQAPEPVYQAPAPVDQAPAPVYQAPAPVYQPAAMQTYEPPAQPIVQSQTQPVVPGPTVDNGMQMDSNFAAYQNYFGQMYNPATGSDHLPGQWAQLTPEQQAQYSNQVSGPAVPVRLSRSMIA